MKKMYSFVQYHFLARGKKTFYTDTKIMVSRGTKMQQRACEIVDVT